MAVLNALVVYAQVRQGILTYEEFHEYLLKLEEDARADGIDYGRETGWNDGYNAGIIDGRSEY